MSAPGFDPWDRPVEPNTSTFRPKPVGVMVRIPDLTAEELFGSLIQALDLEVTNDGFAGWDFFSDRGGADLGYHGRQYEVWSYRKPRRGSMWASDIRAGFAEVGCAGVIPAFYMWLLQQQPRGHSYTTLPPTAAMCWYSYQAREFAGVPCHHRDERGSRLYMLTPPHKADPDLVYLAFKET
jgi:hypothetical protein